MTIESWLLFIAISLIPVISPGPAIFLAIKNATQHGARPTLCSSTGNALGILVIGYLVCYGLGALMNASALLFNIIKWAGAIYLIYLGIKAWRDKSLSIHEMPELKRLPGYRLFFEGFIVSVANPKAIALISAIFPTFITTGESLILQATILSFTFTVMCFLNHLLIIVCASSIKKKLSIGQNLIIFRRILASLFISFGVALGLTSRHS